MASGGETIQTKRLPRGEGVGRRTGAAFVDALAERVGGDSASICKLCGGGKSRGQRPRLQLAP